MTHLIIREEGAAAWVTMNRPERLNALNPQMVTELREFFDGLYWRPQVRVVVLSGAGRAFCAGLDLKEHPAATTKSSVGDTLTAQRNFTGIVTAMRQCPQPIIALVNGTAIGAGFALAVACDVRLATPTTRLNAGFMRIGLSACELGLSYFLPRMIGSSAAAEFLLAGRFIDGERAYDLGLVSQVIAEDKLEEEARSLANDMLRATPLGLRLTKDALNRGIDAPSLEAAMAMEDRNQALCSRSDDFGEGVAAFLEKREPRYSGR